MRRPGRPLKPEERELWRRYARSINHARQEFLGHVDAKPRPLLKTRPHSIAPLAQPKAQSKPRSRDDQSHLDAATARRLRRGQARIDARLDLHGMRQGEAQDALVAFILRARDRGHRCILIITGKGTKGAGHSNPYEASGPGILRTRLRQWLAQEPLRGLCYGLEEAHPRHGGAGAFYVFIRKKG